MKIPGTEGNRGTSVARAGTINEVQPDNQRTAQAIGNAANVTGNVAGDLMQEELQRKQAADRLAASNHLLDYEAAAVSIRQDITGKLASGELVDEDEAAAAYRDAMSGADAFELPKIGDQTSADLRLGMKRVRAGLDGEFDNIIRKSRTDRAEAQFLSFADGIGKMVADPKSDLALLDARLDGAGEQAVRAGVPRDRVAALAQNAKDRNWTNAVTERVIRNKDSMGELTAIERDLTAEDGRYFLKLDTEKRNALLAQVLGAKDRLTSKQEAAAAKRDASAERAIREYQQVIASGFPVSDELRSRVAQSARGTQLEGQYLTLQLEERAVSEFLKKPVAEQQAYLVDRERQLRAGGVSDTSEISLFKSLSNAFGSNIKALSERPIEMHETRTGEELPTLSPSLFMTPEGAVAAAQVMRDRVATLNAMENQYGTVGRAPLKQAEADQLGQILKQQSPTKRAEMLGLFAKGFDDPETFKGAVKQMLGDDPRAYAAGMAHGLNFRTTEGRRLGDMIEQGSAILRDKSIIKTKANGSDGTRELFNQEVGEDTIPVGSPDREMYYQSALAIYAKLAAEEGKLGYDLQGPLFKRALNLATGGLIDVRGQRLVAPRWGMNDDQLTDAINSQLKAAADANGVDYGDLLDMRLIPDDKVPGRYYLKQDAIHYQPGKDGRPLYIEVR